MQLTFVPAQTSDLNSLAALVNSAYRGESSKQGWTTEADLLGGQRTDPESLIEKLGSIYWAASPLDQKPVACLELTRMPLDPSTAYVGMLTVAPTHQSLGLGRQLLAFAEQQAKDWDCSSIRMTVIDRRSELIAYYERRGYQLTGDWEPFPETDPKFGIPKVAQLRLLEMKKSL